MNIFLYDVHMLFSFHCLDWKQRRYPLVIWPSGERLWREEGLKTLIQYTDRFKKGSGKNYKTAVFSKTILYSAAISYRIT